MMARQIQVLTPEELRQLHERQGGKCAVCDKPPAAGKELLVDHDPRTGLVKGLLCYRCWTFIEMVDRDPERILRMADFIEKYPDYHKTKRQLPNGWWVF
jgi:hypothetical protein